MADHRLIDLYALGIWAAAKINVALGGHRLYRLHDAEERDSLGCHVGGPFLVAEEYESLAAALVALLWVMRVMP
jgi:hypothetical protein